MLSRLWAALRGPPAPLPLPLPPGTSAVLESLAARVDALENERTELLMAWAQTREQWVRTLKRMGAIKGRESSGSTAELANLELVEEEDEDQLAFEALAAKLRGSRG